MSKQFMRISFNDSFREIWADLSRIESIDNNKQSITLGMTSGAVIRIDEGNKERRSKTIDNILKYIEEYTNEQTNQEDNR